MTRSTIEGGRGCNEFVPVSRGNGTKLAPTGYIFDQPPGGMSWIRGKLADHVGGHVVLSPEEGVLVTSTGTESSYPRPPQSLNSSGSHIYGRHPTNVPGGLNTRSRRFNWPDATVLFGLAYDVCGGVACGKGWGWGMD